MDDSPAITTVERLLTYAIEQHASDIHLEPTPQGLRVRFRIDGLLSEGEAVLSELAAAVLARLKVLARLDIAEKRMPQDGKFTFAAPQGPIDIRVATFPSVYGEKIVVRLLDRLQRVNNLGQLGFSAEMLTRIKQLMQKTQGFFIVTGPTGSGKTTTLYSLMTSLCSPEKNMVTLEDPVEYTIAGCTQAQVHPDIGFDFAKGIRAVLRQDPDIIMVGEMRDSETAQTAVQAALTGHLVLSTLHTNDAPSAIIRLLDMGIKSFLINGAVTGILAQRLVRVLCAHCKQQAPLTPEEQAYLAEHKATVPQAYKAYGCQACKQTGYQGRMGVFELLPITERMRAVVHDDVGYDELQQIARAEGMRPLHADALEKVAAGLTSVHELMRVLA